MPRGKKPTAHRTRSIDLARFTEYLGLRQQRTQRNVSKSLRRGKLTYSVSREIFLGRARHRKHALRKRYRRR